VTYFFKCGGAALKERLHKLIIQIWEQKQMPEYWNKGLIFPVFKKGNKMEGQNYNRGLMLLNHSIQHFLHNTGQKSKPLL
jgi:hypothetical protein